MLLGSGDGGVAQSCSIRLQIERSAVQVRPPPVLYERFDGSFNSFLIIYLRSTPYKDVVVAE